MAPQRISQGDLFQDTQTLTSIYVPYDGQAGFFVVVCFEGPYFSILAI